MNVHLLSCRNSGSDFKRTFLSVRVHHSLRKNEHRRVVHALYPRKFVQLGIYVLKTSKR